MATVQELSALGHEIGLTGLDLKEFIKEQQNLAREEREKEREYQREKDEKDRQYELERQKEITKQMEVEAELKKTLHQEQDGSHHRDDDDSDHESTASTSKSHKGYKMKGPKMVPFDERDDMGSYLHRFERYAVLQGWTRSDWAVYLSALLKGKALDVYARLPLEQSQDYGKLKEALLKRYALTEEGYKQRFYESKPERGEAPQQFITRLESYFERWIELAKVEKSYEGVRDLMVKERFLATCHKPLELFLRERAVTELVELGKLAEQYEDAHGTKPNAKREYESSSSKKPVDETKRTCFTCGKVGHVSAKCSKNTGRASPSKGAGRKPKCFICHKVGHIARNCFQGQQASAMIPAEQRPRYSPQFNQNRFAKRPNISVRTQDQSQVTGRSDDDERQALVYCKTHNRLSCTECNNVVPGHTCNAMLGTEVELKCGCIAPVLADACGISCKMNAKMPVTDGKLEGKDVTVLRDTGCSTIVVKRKLVSDDRLTGKMIVCVMIDGTARRYPEARVDIETQYLSGTVNAVCMDKPLYDVIVGNVEGVNEVVDLQVGSKPNSEAEDQPLDLNAVVTRAQAKKNPRVRPLHVTESIDSELTTDELKDLQERDVSLAKWWEAARGTKTESSDEKKTRYVIKNGLLWRKKEEEKRKVTQLVVPTPLREKVMKLAHDNIMSGHQGIKKTYERVVSQFFWPGTHGDVTRYCQSCDVCQRTVVKGRVIKTPLGKMPLIEIPFKRVAVDLVGPIAPVTDRGNRYILTMVDYATRYPEAIALKSIEAETVAEALVTMYSRVGIPEEVLSDQGSQFMSGVMKEVSRLLSMKQLVTTPYHPMCNGLVERFNGTLKTMLKRMCVEKPKDWDRYLPALLFAYREVPQESLGFSPFELLYGRTVRGPMTILKEMWTKEVTEPDVKLTYQYVVELQERLQDTCELAREELSKSQGRQKKYYDVKSKDRKFKVGDKVLLLLPTDTNKLLMQWKGPFEIMECRNDNNYRVQLNGRLKLFHANMLKKYVERKTTEVELLNAAVVEDSHDVEMGEISEFVDEQKENFKNVNINPQLSSEQKEEVTSLLSEFTDLFTDVPKVTNLGNHSIQLTSSEPIRSKAYPLPFAMRAAVDKELDAMLASGVIEPSTASYASPIVVVKKHDGSNRICIDFRKLNKITIFDPEPLPQMRDIFAELSGSRFFSKFDFCKGYWQVPMCDEDKDLTTFVTHRGLFRFNVMPFGLVNAPATFSRIMRKLLNGLRDLHNYLDDVLGHTSCWRDHVVALREFFCRVRAANLALKPSKCFVGYTDLVFLGHKIGQEGVSPSEELVQKIQQVSPPSTKKQLRSFLGLVGYYRTFVPNFAAIAVPLTDLTKKGAPNILVWTEAQDQSFRMLKQCVCRPPVLRLPDVSKPFILQTDASCDGIGAILLQEEDQVKHPVAFASKKLLPRERNYSTIEREALAIVWGVQKFENYLLGVHFFLETDHHPLQYLQSAKFQNGRVMRWSLILQPYRFTVRAIKGSDNVGADFLSRIAA